MSREVIRVLRSAIYSMMEEVAQITYCELWCSVVLAHLSLEHAVANCTPTLQQPSILFWNFAAGAQQIESTYTNTTVPPCFESTPSSERYSMKFAFVRTGAIFTTFVMHSVISRAHLGRIKKDCTHHGVRMGNGFQGAMILRDCSRWSLSDMLEKVWASIVM